MSTEDRIAAALPLRLLERALSRDVTSIFYHAFAAAPLPHITPVYAVKRPEDFERDLVYLKAHFNVVSHDEIVAHRAGGRRLPERAASVSFDDGFRECFTVARPLLKKHAVPATFFVCNDFIDNKKLMYRNRVALCLSKIDAVSPTEAAHLVATLAEAGGTALESVAAARAWLLSLGYADAALIDRACGSLGISVADFLRERQPYLTRKEIEQLHEEGFTIGGHTSDHPELHRLDWGQIRQQLIGSCELIRQITGRAQVPFAFPFNGLRLSRTKLESMRSELGSIDLMYDTNNLMRDRDFILNRICGDIPAGATATRSNLPRLIGRARLLEPLRIVRRGARSLAG